MDAKKSIQKPSTFPIKTLFALVGVMFFAFTVFQITTYKMPIAEDVTPTPPEVGADLQALNPTPVVRQVAAVGDLETATKEVSLFGNIFLQRLSEKDWVAIKPMLDLPDYSKDLNEMPLSPLLYEVNTYSTDNVYGGSLNSDTIVFDGSYANATISHDGFSNESTITFVKRDTGWKIYSLE